ncbi:MAG: hypothetical protein K8L99_12215 [Anaerolineae bacterium]|nr:hypothetical protein [Anaerolineae bacterium]
MSKRNAWIFVVLLLLFAAAQKNAGAESSGFRPDAPQYALRGPYTVGTRDPVIGGEAHWRSLSGIPL